MTTTLNLKTNILRYAVFSDLHVNGRNSLDEVLKSQTHYIMDNPEAKDWDMVFISGDFFDRCASFVDNDIISIMYWIQNFLRWAGKHDVAVRVLKGTPSHDWNQNELFEILSKDIPNLDFKYHKSLEIDYVERLSSYVLYLPDEWGEGPEQTYHEVLELLKDKGINKVDYAITHGFFDFQIPKHLKKIIGGYHNSSKWSKLVKRMIYNGHDHTPKSHLNIQVPGSFNRNKHGEEEAKGFWVGEMVGAKDNVVFKENKLAHIYKTIDVRGMDDAKAFEYIGERVKDLPARSNIRLVVNSGDAMSMAIPSLQMKWPTLKFDPPDRRDVVAKDEAVVEVKDIRTIEMVELNETNFMAHVQEHLKTKDQMVINRLKELHDSRH